MYKLLYFALINQQSCNQTVDCHRTPVNGRNMSSINHNIDYNHHSNQFRRLTL